MGFASNYLDNRVLLPEIIKEAPDKATAIIIVVPAYNEPGICKLLDSLALCTIPECKVEVIVVVNAPEDAEADIITNNKITISNIESWKTNNNKCFFRLFAFNAEHYSLREWGVGLARKVGMDEAVRRFNSINKHDGIILNLDADCLVEENYFISLYNELLLRKERTACSIYFEHPLSGTDFQIDIYRYIAMYELHLRYYFQGLAYSDFPYVFHTVGSAVAVKALAYVKAGGMNRRKAGEDFYFIQKLVPAGGFFTLNSTTVYPSPRPSSRVPFGTGASIKKLMEGGHLNLLTYNMQAFKELQSFFALTEQFYNCKTDKLREYHNSIPPGLNSFIDKEEWIEKMTEIKNNSSGLPSFKKRFFGWFNMFRIVKYLNWVHLGIFEKKPVNISASELLEYAGITFASKDPVELLLYYRAMEKNS